MAEPSCEGSRAASGRSRLRGADLARQALWRFAANARGSTAMEYALIGALIFIVAAGSIRYYGSRMTPIYERISTTVSQAN